jgi:hypothetical protein
MHRTALIATVSLKTTVAATTTAKAKATVNLKYTITHNNTPVTLFNTQQHTVTLL